MGKRFLAVFLGLVMILSMNVNAFAGTDQTVPAEDGILSGEVITPTEDPASDDQAAFAEEDGSPDDAGDILIGDDGNYYVVEVEDLDRTDTEDYEEGYDPDILADAKEALAIQEEASVPEILEAVYDLTIDRLPADTEAKAAAAFLNELLAYACADDRVNIDHVLADGTDAEGTQTSWILVRLSEEGPYYILNPAADLGRSGAAEGAEDDEDAWAGFLLGLEDFSGYTADEEFRTEEFSAAHPVSEKTYEEPAAEPEENGEDTGDAKGEEPDPAEDAGTEDASEKDTGEVTEEVSEASELPEKASNSEEETESALLDAYTLASGTFSDNPSANWAITTSDWSNFVLTIDGSGGMPNYGGNASSRPWVQSVYSSYINQIVIGKNITYIGSDAFYGMTGVTSVKFSCTNMQNMGYRAFAGCTSLKKISLPSGLLNISSFAFYNCTSLTSVTIPSTVTTINNGAFQGCSSLSLTLPSGLTSIGSQALYGCKAVYYPGSTSDWYRIGGSSAVDQYVQVYYTKDISNATITLSATSLVYNGKVRKPSVTVTYNGTTLVKGTDYKLTYKKQSKAGKSYVKVTGINSYSGSVKKTFTITKKKLKGAKVTGVTNLGYTGKARTHSKLKVRVKLNGKYVTLKKGTDYTLKYYRNKKISSKTKAYVRITGKGNYKGTLKKTFRIVKGSPGLKFASKKLTKKSVAGAFTRKAKKSVSASLTLTYKSSNKAVATVGKKNGKVTPKKVGTTTITVTSKATKLYKAGKASYKLTIRGCKLKELGYTWENYNTYNIPESTFRLFYSASTARTYYRNYYNMGDGGCCFGISASSMMMNTPGSGIKASQFASGAKYPSYFSWWNYRYSSSAYTYKNTGITLENVVEAMHVAQVSSAAQKYLWNKNLTQNGVGNRIAKLVKAVRTGKPVLVAVTDPNSGGHALVAYKVKNVNSSVSHLYIYDCNWPGQTRYITLYKNNGKYTGGWYYYMDSNTIWGNARGGRLTFITDPQFKSIWKNRKAATRLSQMIVSTDNFEIRDAGGQVAAVMKDGVFTSENEEIFLGEVLGSQTDNHLINLPSGEYSVVNTDPLAKNMEVTALDTEQSLTVETEASAVTVNVNDAEHVSTAVIDAAEGEAFEVTVVSDAGEEVEEIVFTGEGTGSEVTLGIEDGACILDNAEGVEMSVNGEAVAYVES